MLLKHLIAIYLQWHIFEKHVFNCMCNYMILNIWGIRGVFNVFIVFIAVQVLWLLVTTQINDSVSTWQLKLTIELLVFIHVASVVKFISFRMHYKLPRVKFSGKYHYCALFPWAINSIHGNTIYPLNKPTLVLSCTMIKDICMFYVRCLVGNQSEIF